MDPNYVPIAVGQAWTTRCGLEATVVRRTDGDTRWPFRVFVDGKAIQVTSQGRHYGNVDSPFDLVTFIGEVTATVDVAQLSRSGSSKCSVVPHERLHELTLAREMLVDLGYTFDTNCWVAPDPNPLMAKPSIHGLSTSGAYGLLGQVLNRAHAQAASGKGRERHAIGETPFEQQPMATINRQLGSVHGFIYQAHKKSLEAMRLPAGRDVAELLGAINYLAGAVIALESWAAKSEAA